MNDNEINVYQIGNTPDSLQKAIIELRSEYDAHIHDGIGTKNFQTVTADTVSARSMLVRKLSYTDNNGGIWMGVVQNIMKLNLGNATNYIKWDGSTLTIAGSLVAGSISIPNATNPTFSVDSSGNAVVNSLRRKDFAWFTVFESKAGYSQTINGAGSITDAPSQVTLNTGATNGNNTQFQKTIVATTASQFTWDKNRHLKCLVNFGNDTNQDVAFGCGQMIPAGGGLLRQMGFYVADNALNGVVGDGSGRTNVSMGTIVANTTYLLEFNYVAGVGVEFFKNGVSQGSTAVNLPSGTTGAGYMLDSIITTDENSAKSFGISYWDFWQAN